MKRMMKGMMWLLFWFVHATANAAKPEPNVFVIGALHELHTSEDAFSYEALRRLLEQIKPEILVLEVRPDELAERGKTPGRPEYQAVVWPLLKATTTRAIAMEPGGDEFRRISGAAGASYEAARAKDPGSAIFLDSLDASLETALKSYWDEPADTQDTVTSDLTRAVAIVQAQKYGSAFVAAQTEWDQFMAARAVEAVVKNPDKRVVVLGSFRNRALLVDAIKRVSPYRLVDVAAYMRSSGQVRSPVSGGDPSRK